MVLGSKLVGCCLVEYNCDGSKRMRYILLVRSFLAVRIAIMFC